MTTIYRRNSACRYLASVIVFGLISQIKAQNESGTQIAVSVDAGEGLVYLLVIIFFSINFCTPVVRFVYVNYLAGMVERAAKEVAKAKKKLSERVSDAGRKVSQSVRAA